jgi:hypothetical protein
MSSAGSASTFHQLPRRLEEPFKETSKQAAKRRLLRVKEGAISVTKSRCFVASIENPLLVTNINTEMHGNLKRWWRQFKVRK